MQELPPGISIKLSIVALLALGLAMLACVAVITVLFAARRPILPFQQIKSVAVTLLWIVPALGVVCLIGNRWESRHYFDRPQLPAESRSAIREEMRSTIRQSSSKPAPIVVTASQTTVTESPSATTAIAVQAEAALPPAETEASGQVAIPTVETAMNRIPQSGSDAKFSNSAPVDGVLKVLETRVGAPDWAEKVPVPGDKGILVSLSSQRFATLQEAEQQLTAKAVSYVKEFYRDEYPLPGDWSVPVSIIETNAMRKLVGETFDQDFGNGIQGTMYRAHLQLELNSAMRNALHDSWHGQIVEHRLIVLGSMLGLVTLMLATSAGYFRLDDLTGGLYRRRLKFAAASLIAAGSLVALVVA